MAFTNESSGRTDPSNHVVGTLVRCGAAIAILVSGLVHLQLYFDGYRDFPNDNLGRSFIANAVASVLIAALLVVRRDGLVRLAGAGLLAATLIAFWLSRSGDGIFGFTERGLEPSPQASLALVAEIAGLVLLAMSFVPAIGAGDKVTAAVAVPAVAVALIVSIGGAALWARSPAAPSDAESAPSPPASPTTQPQSPTTAAAPGTTAPPDTTAPPETTAPPTTESTKPKRKRDRPTAPPTTTTAAPMTTTAAPTTTTAAPTTTTAAPTTTAAATTPPAPEAQVVTISIVDFAFQPDGMEIAVGTTVEWINEDSFKHTVVANDGSFASEDLEAGDRFSFTFTEPGTFDYICGIHPSMTAGIVVTG